MGLAALFDRYSTLASSITQATEPPRQHDPFSVYRNATARDRWLDAEEQPSYPPGADVLTVTDTDTTVAQRLSLISWQQNGGVFASVSAAGEPSIDWPAVERAAAGWRAGDVCAAIAILLLHARAEGARNA